jgi:hypothetical protein
MRARTAFLCCFVLSMGFQGSICLAQAISDGTWSVTVLAGTAGKAGTVDGADGSALLSAPTGLAGVGSTLYFSQASSLRAVNLSADGTVSTLVPVLFPGQSPSGTHVIRVIPEYIESANSALRDMVWNFRQNGTSCSRHLGKVQHGRLRGISSSARQGKGNSFSIGFGFLCNPYFRIIRCLSLEFHS